MGRARGNQHTKSPPGFERVIGSGRGNRGLADVASPRPSEAARAEVQRLRAEVCGGVFEEALDLLGAHRQRLQAPLLSELAGEVAAAALDPLRFPNAAAILAARGLLARTGIRDDRCDHILADVTYQTFHLWPTGHTHAIDVFGEGAERQDRYTHLPFGPTACGQPVTGELVRALRGDWLRASADSGARCLRCDDFAHKFSETRENWPAPLLSPNGDAEIARSLAEIATPALESAFEDGRSLWALQDALVPLHREAVLAVLSQHLAEAPSWQLWRMLGAQAVPTLNMFRRNGTALFSGALSASDWHELLEAAPEELDIFRSRLAERLAALTHGSP
jgi:hypothetical protein